jgi:hypothetical protein
MAGVLEHLQQFAKRDVLLHRDDIAARHHDVLDPVPGFVLVCLVAIMGVYFSAKQANDAELDAQLGRLAGSARLALRSGTGGTRTPGLRAFLAKEEFQLPGQYFELWTSDGMPELRSPNLGKADLPRATPRPDTRHA